MSDKTGMYSVRAILLLITVVSTGFHSPILLAIPKAVTCGTFFGQYVSNQDQSSLQLQLRVARAEDREQVIAFIRAVRIRDKFDPDFNALGKSLYADFSKKPGASLLSKGKLLLLKDQNAQVVGTAGYLRKNAKSAELIRIYVDQVLQNQGIGRKLLQNLINKVFAFGIETIRLQTRDEMSDAVRVYERIGFLETSSHKPGLRYFTLSRENWLNHLRPEEIHNFGFDKTLP